MLSFTSSKSRSSGLPRTENALRRLPWLYRNLTARKARNVAAAVGAFLTKSPRASRFPPILKVDISPACNLRCPTCVHAEPGDDPRLQRQRFSASQRMSVADFTVLVREVSGYTSAVSLYYLGDPLAHPDITTICSVSREADLNVHISTNLSFRLSDAKLQALVSSGLTHLSVCVDGMTQATYGRTRVGGDVKLVLDNLRRIVALKRAHRLRHLQIEMQYIEFEHNAHEVQHALALADALGLEQFCVFRGHTYNYTDVDPDTYEHYDPFEASALPKCWWPYVYMLIRYDGETIPCCTYRTGEQYTETDHHSQGNVFEHGVANVWNSEAYRRTRALVAAPRSSSQSGFCTGCHKLFRSNYHSVARRSRVLETAQASRFARRRLEVVE